MRTEARAEPGEPRHLPQVGEELLDLALQLVPLLFALHLAGATHAARLLGMPLLRRAVKLVAATFALPSLRLVRGRARDAGGEAAEGGAESGVVERANETLAFSSRAGG